jgi:hypothetical protein
MQTHVHPDTPCLESDLPHYNLHQLPIDLLPASRALIQGIFNQLLLDTVQPAAMGTVVNPTIPRSACRIRPNVSATT